MTDEVLLLEIQKNPSKGFDLLFKEYSALVLNVCRRVILPLGTAEDAQECASDVFVSFFKNRESFDPSRCSIKGFLAFSAKNAAIDRYRKLKKENGQTSSLEDIGEEGLPFRPPAFEKIESSEKSRFIADAIRSLGEPDSTILMRKYFLGESAKEIASALSLAPGTVQKRAWRALEKLKNKLSLGGVLLD